MNNPNAQILLTEDGHPIGDLVISDGNSRPVDVTDDAVEENRHELLRTQAAELLGEPDADVAVAELYPGYSDTAKRRQAVKLFIVEQKNLAEISSIVGVPERVVSMWMFNDRWDELARKELAARQSQANLELARIRAEKRAKVARAQLEAAEKVRDAGLKALESGHVKGAAEAIKSAADVEARILGVSESGALDNTANDDKKTKQDTNGKTPLVMVFQGGLPPLRKV